MTREMLNQWYYLKREIQYEEQRLEMLESKACRMTPTYDGVALGSSCGNRVEEYASLIADQRMKIRTYKAELKAIEAYIDAIPDSQTRQIFRLRFHDRLPWQQVASVVGGNNTEDSVRKTVSRYLDKQ